MVSYCPLLRTLKWNFHALFLRSFTLNKLSLHNFLSTINSFLNKLSQFKRFKSNFNNLSFNKFEKKASERQILNNEEMHSLTKKVLRFSLKGKTRKRIFSVIIFHIKSKNIFIAKLKPEGGKSFRFWALNGWQLFRLKRFYCSIIKECLTLKCFHCFSSSTPVGNAFRIMFRDS